MGKIWGGLMIRTEIQKRKKNRGEKAILWVILVYIYIPFS